MTTILLAAQAAQNGGGGGMFLIMMIAIFAIMWFFMVRPQQKKQKEIRNFQNSLQPGVEVVTQGGVYGTIKRIDTTTNRVELEISRGVTIEVDRNFLFAANAPAQTTK